MSTKKMAGYEWTLGSGGVYWLMLPLAHMVLDPIKLTNGKTLWSMRINHSLISPLQWADYGGPFTPEEGAAWLIGYVEREAKKLAEVLLPKHGVINGCCPICRTSTCYVETEGSASHE